MSDDETQGNTRLAGEIARVELRFQCLRMALACIDVPAASLNTVVAAARQIEAYVTGRESGGEQPQRKTAEWRAEALELYRQGMRPREIGRRLGRSAAAVSALIARHPEIPRHNKASERQRAYWARMRKTPPFEQVA